MPYSGGPDALKEVRMVLNSLGEPLDSRADGPVAVVSPSSGDSPARSKPGAGSSLNGAAQGWQPAVPPGGSETRANAELIAASRRALSG